MKLFYFLSVTLLLSSLLTNCEKQIEQKQPKPLQATKETTMSSNRVTLPSGLSYEILVAAPEDAQKPKKGTIVTVHYTGWLDEAGKQGKKFDSSKDRNQPFQFPIGMGYVIKGWDEGVMDMKVGEKRMLYIPAALGYGAQSVGGVIPANANLIFEVELLGVAS